MSAPVILPSAWTNLVSTMSRLVQLLVNDSMLIFLGTLQAVLANCECCWDFWLNETTVVSTGICNTSISPKFNNQMHQLCGEVGLSNFYLLLYSILSILIYFCVKRITQACCLHDLKNMAKYFKTQLWEEIQNRVLFWITW